MCSTGQRFICIDVTSYKIHTLTVCKFVIIIMHLNLHPMIIFQGGTCKSISCWNRNVRDFRKKLTSLYMRVGQKGWKKVHYWLHVVCSQSSHRMNAKYYTTTMWLHFYCIEDGAWIADRFLVVLPPRWRVVWTFLRPIGNKSVLKTHLNFCAQGDSITGHKGTFCPVWVFFFLFANIFYSEMSAKMDMDQLSSLSWPHGFDQPPPKIKKNHKLLVNFPRFYMPPKCVRKINIVWTNYPPCFSHIVLKDHPLTISRVICRFPEIMRDF